jgi:hypothetical protein
MSFCQIYYQNSPFVRGGSPKIKSSGAASEGLFRKPLFIAIALFADKARLSLTANSIKSGRILFPKRGAERLIEQLVGFGVERHDDLVDAFTILVLEVVSDKHVPVSLTWI